MFMKQHCMLNSTHVTKQIKKTCLLTSLGRGDAIRKEQCDGLANFVSVTRNCCETTLRVESDLHD